jgi:hypothetical protein
MILDRVSERLRDLGYEIPGRVIPYDAAGVWLYWRTGLSVGASYEVWVDGAVAARVVATASGAALRLRLDVGDFDVELKMLSGQVVARGVLSVRHWAAFAQVVAEEVNARLDRLQLAEEGIDVDIAEGAYLAALARLSGLGDSAQRQIVRLVREAQVVSSATVRGVEQAATFGWVVPWQDVARTSGPDLLWQVDQRAAIGALPLFNAIAATWVHAAYGGATLAFPGPFRRNIRDRLTVSFPLGWDRGSVVVTYVNGASETFTPAGSQPLAAAEVVVGRTFVEDTISSASRTAAGTTGSASIGAATRRPLRAVDAGPVQPGSGTLQLFVTGGLQWRSGTVVFGGRGGVRVPAAAVAAVWAARGGYTYAARDIDGDGTGDSTAARMFIDVGDARVVPVAIALGASSAAATATAVNAAAIRNGVLGGSRSTGRITCPTGAALLAADAGDTGTQEVAVTDARGTTRTFEFRRSGSSSASTVRVLYTGTETAAQIAALLAAAITLGSRDGAGATPTSIPLQVIAAVDGADVVLQAVDFGAAGNATITVAGTAGFVVTGMSGGVDGAGALARVSDSALTLDGQGIPTRALAVYGPDLAECVGRPTEVTTLGADAAIGDVTVTVGSGVAVPRPDEPVEFAETLDNGTFTAFDTPARPTSLDVRFDASWRGGAVVLSVVDAATSAARDIVVPSAVQEVVRTTLAFPATTAFLAIANSGPSAIRVGDFVRRADGVGGWVTAVWPDAVRTTGSFTSGADQEVVVWRGGTTRVREPVTSVTRVSPSTVIGGGTGRARVFVAGVEALVPALVLGYGRGRRGTGLGLSWRASGLLEEGTLRPRYDDAWIEVLSGTAWAGDLNGLYEVVSSPRSDRWALRPIDRRPVDVGTASDTVTLRIISRGQIVRPVRVSGTSVRLLDPLLVGQLSGTSLELRGGDSARVREDVSWLELAADPDVLPAVNVTQAVGFAAPSTLVTVAAPDGWFFTGATGAVEAAGRWASWRWALTATGSSVVATSPVIAWPRGRAVRVEVAVATTGASRLATLELSVDGGATWTASTNTTLTRAPREGAYPTLLATTVVALGAGIQARITVASGSGEVVTVEFVRAAPALRTAPDAGGASSFLQLWRRGPVGNVEDVKPAHVAIDVQNVTRVGGPRGSSLASATVTRCNYVADLVRPYLVPSALTPVTETLTPVSPRDLVPEAETWHTGPSEAGSELERVVEVGASDLPRAGSPLPWAWVDDQTVRIDSAWFVSGATYALTSERLVRAESTVEDLGSDAAARAWFGYLDAWVRHQNAEIRADVVREGAQVVNGEVTVETPSDVNEPPRFYRNGRLAGEGVWIDAFRARPPAGLTAGILEIERRRSSTDWTPQALLRLEVRGSNVDAASVASATWIEVTPGSAHTSWRWMAWRVTARGVRNLDDVRIYGFGSFSPTLT